MTLVQIYVLCHPVHFGSTASGLLASILKVGALVTRPVTASLVLRISGLRQLPLKGTC